MKLYGTTSSPFVRRVRVVAEEVGEVVDRIDTATEAGLAALREVSPIGKLDGILQLFYLRREGFAVDGTPYA